MVWQPPVSRIAWAAWAMVAVLAHRAGPAAALEISGNADLEMRGFAASPRYPDQTRNNVSGALTIEIHHRWDDGRQTLSFSPFARVDSADGARTHADIRELMWERARADHELRIGIGKVFWGVTESQHLVDIVNQTDLVENVDGEDKLGQPMINLALIGEHGTLDVFVLPGFRPRTFPGRRGRLRASLVVDPDRDRYESSRETRRIDFAARYSRVVGDFDLAVSHFFGTAREPVLVATLDSGLQPVLAPRYDLLHQTGLEIQATRGSWLWKFEGVRRHTRSHTSLALTAGFEYTFFGVADSSADIGILAEYLFDGRGRRAPTPFADDVFLGTRFVLNDASSTEVLAGAIVDRDGDGAVLSVEASRRLGNGWTAALDGRVWAGGERGGALRALDRDDHLGLTLSFHF